ncbi:MAG: tetratricopeptide repeat protein [Planctomycetales bacterium]|nr:tetratricopeptide repeat protein [Planctomycetales bacterium]
MATLGFLTDFGLAKSVATGSKLTRTGQALGTPGYMSPEQARGEVSSLTPATDVWSLGCVLYELLAGRPAFEGETTAAVIGRVLVGEPTRLESLRGGVPRGLALVVRVCLAKRTRDRYRDAAGLREDLERVLRGERPRRRPPGHARARLGIAALALTVAGAAWAAGAGTARTPDAGPPEAPPGPSEAEALAARARAVRQSDPRGAAELLGRALEREPGTLDWRLERGLLLWAVGDWERARREWDLVPPDSSRGAAAALYRAMEERSRRIAVGPALRAELATAARSPGREGRLARAILDSIAERWGPAREALAGLEGWEAALERGYIEANDPRGDRAIAVREYTQVLAEGPPLALAWGNRGYARLVMGELAAAIGDLTKAIELDARNATNYLNRGEAFRETGDLDGALRDLESALTIRPGFADALANRALVRRLKGDMAGALDDYTEALRLSPRDSRAYYSRGVVRTKLGDLDGAIADFGTSLSLNPRFSPAHQDRGVILYDRGDREGARRDFEAALACDPGNASSFMGRARVRADDGDLDAALSDLDAALRLDPRSAAAYNYRGNVRGKLNDHDGALADFTAAIALAPDDPFHYAGRAFARFSKRDLEGAEADWTKALELAPSGWPQRKRAERELERIRRARGDR